MGTDPLILVTGATGKTGRRVSALLREGGYAVREASRSSETRFDWSDPETWDAALDGVHTIYLVPPYSDGGDTLRTFVDRAVAAGAKKVVLVSTPETDPDYSPTVTENLISGAGLALTALRLRWFNQNFSEDFLAPSVKSGDLRLPAGDGKEAFIDADDIAAVAAAALTDDAHNDRVYELTGPRLLGFADIAEELTRATGQTVTYTPLSAEDFIAEQIAYGTPEDWAHASAGLYQGIAHHALETTTRDVETILGRPPRDFTEYATAAAAAGQLQVEREN